MDNIKQSAKILFGVKNHEKTINDFCKSKYDEKFKDMKRDIQSYHYYDGFEIVSETKIKIKWAFGYADMEYNDHMIIDI
jgi:hypothetical protein